MFERKRRRRQRARQERRPDIEFAEPCAVEPLEGQREFALAAHEGPGSCEQARTRGELRQEVQADFVVLPPAVVEEVLHHPQHAFAMHGLRQFFLQLAHDCGGSGFAGLDPSAGHRPERIALDAVQQHSALVQHDRCGSQVEAMRVGVERDHGRRRNRPLRTLPCP